MNVIARLEFELAYYDSASIALIITPRGHPSKKHWVTHQLQETDMSSTNKGAGIYNSKKGVLYEWKKDLEEFLRRKTSHGKTCLLFRQEYSE